MLHAVKDYHSYVLLHLINKMIYHLGGVDSNKKCVPFFSLLSFSFKWSINWYG